MSYSFTARIRNANGIYASGIVIATKDSIKKICKSSISAIAAERGWRSDAWGSVQTFDKPE